MAIVYKHSNSSQHKPGDKFFCLISMPEIANFKRVINVIPKKGMILTLKDVYSFNGSTLFSFVEIIDVRNGSIQAFSSDYFIPYDHLSEEEKHQYDLFHFCIN